MYCFRKQPRNKKSCLFIDKSQEFLTTSRRLADRKVERFEKNILKRGAVPETATKKGKDYPVGPILLGFFVFVVIGSCECYILEC
uniref:Stress-associated endoplasmic reticulum protein 2-like n=1 Tax=Cucumis melo TaxID=3656 RepID=A0A9I9EEX6_CUCME